VHLAKFHVILPFKRVTNHSKPIVSYKINSILLPFFWEILEQMVISVISRCYKSNTIDFHAYKQLSNQRKILLFDKFLSQTLSYMLDIVNLLWTKKSIVIGLGSLSRNGLFVWFV
jgi:hypothetical protein